MPHGSKLVHHPILKAHFGNKSCRSNKFGVGLDAGAGFAYRFGVLVVFESAFRQYLLEEQQNLVCAQMREQGLCIDLVF